MKCIWATAIAIAACTQVSTAQTYFAVERAYPQRSCSGTTFTANLSTLTPYSEATVTAAFNTIANSGITFSYPQGGCQQRAEIMHQMLEKQLKLQHARVWLFAPVDFMAGDNRHLEIDDPNNITANGKITWAYHVAPVVIRQLANGKKDTVAIDPSINRANPLPLKDWFAAMGNSSVSRYTFTDARWYFFYMTDNLINGCFYHNDMGNGWPYSHMIAERELAVNDVAAKIIEKLEAGYPDPNGEVRTLVSSANNMIAFYATQERDNSFKNGVQGVSLRTLYTNHPTLMHDMLVYYYERVAYWLKETGRLQALR